MGYSMSAEAAKVIEQIELDSRRRNPDCVSNALPNGNGFYELDRETLPDYGIRGTVYIIKTKERDFANPDCKVARLGRLYINGSGHIIRFPGIPARHWPMYERS